MAVPVAGEQLTSKRLDAVVVGGTYLDRILTTRSEIIANTTVEVDSQSQVLGGPGLALAVAFSMLGVRAGLSTGLGECTASDEARSVLAAKGVTLLGSVIAQATLDSSDLYTSPCGTRVVFNSHQLSLSVDHPANVGDWPATARLAVVASPTPVDVGERVFGAAPPEVLKVALLHTAQARAVADGRCELLEQADIVIASSSDAQLMNAQLRNAGCGFVIVTHGMDGVCVQSAARRDSIRVPQDEKVLHRNENGAGEAFCAALCAFLVKSLPRGETLRLSELLEAVSVAQSYAAGHVRAGGNLEFPRFQIPDRVTASASSL